MNSRLRLADLEFGERNLHALGDLDALPDGKSPLVVRLVMDDPTRVLHLTAFGRRTRLQAYGVINAASFVSFILGQVLARDGGAMPTLLAIGGAASCGWSWLLTRALFDPAEQDARWPRITVGVIWLTGAVSILAAPGQDLLATVAANGYTLSGSAALLMTFVEPLQGFRRSLPSAEKRFRIAFLTVYALLVTFSMLLLGGAEDSNAGLGDPVAVKSTCAIAGLMAAASAIWFRKRHPLHVETAPPPRRAATSSDGRLAERIVEVLREEELYTSPELKVADLAARLAEPEYRVTQSITAALGFPNFNRLINHHRIERAKRMLGDPELRGRPILLIAFDCGFASVGPFNRTFKTETGVTPRAYRKLSEISAVPPNC